MALDIKKVETPNLVQANHKSANRSINLFITLVVTTKEPFSKPHHAKRLASVIFLDIKKHVENQALILYINGTDKKNLI